MFKGMKGHKHDANQPKKKKGSKILSTPSCSLSTQGQCLYLHSRTWSWRSPSRSPCGRTDDWSGGWRTSRHLCSWWSSAWPVRDTTMTCSTACRCVKSRWPSRRQRIRIELKTFCVPRRNRSCSQIPARLRGQSGQMSYSGQIHLDSIRGD